MRNRQELLLHRAYPWSSLQQENPFYFKRNKWNPNTLKTKMNKNQIGKKLYFHYRYTA